MQPLRVFESLEEFLALRTIHIKEISAFPEEGPRSLMLIAIWRLTKENADDTCTDWAGIAEAATILQFYSLCQQAAADSWKDLLLLRSEFSGIVPGVFTPVVAKYSHPNLCHWPYCRQPLPWDYFRVAVIHPESLYSIHGTACLRQ
jgi:hypothetical protein